MFKLYRAVCIRSQFLPSRMLLWTSIFVHQLTHPLRSRVVLFMSLRIISIVQKKKSAMSSREGKKGLMSCKNYANGMEDYSGVVWCFFCVCHHLQQVPRSTITDGLTRAQRARKFKKSRQKNFFLVQKLILVIFEIAKNGIWSRKIFSSN